MTRSDVAMARDLGIDPVSGRPVSVRYGKYGAFAQMGTRDDEEKPKFASLRPGQRMDDVTLADALELFQLPRTLGAMPDGQPIKVAVGRFGPYAQYGTKKYVSLKKEDDPYTITLERALDLIHEKQQIEANRIIREFPDGRHPGAERPLRPVHHRRQEERQDPEGSRTRVADARGMPGDHRGGAGAHRAVGEEDGAREERFRGSAGRQAEESCQEEGCAEEESGGEKEDLIVGVSAPCRLSPEQPAHRQILVQCFPANAFPAADQAPVARSAAVVLCSAETRQAGPTASDHRSG